MVVMLRPATSYSCVWQENARLPSTWTMQAPHRPAPQPNLVPVSLRPSRITHNRGVSRGASLDAGLPLIMKSMAMEFPPRRDDCAASCRDEEDSDFATWPEAGYEPGRASWSMASASAESCGATLGLWIFG